MFVLAAASLAFTFPAQGITIYSQPALSPDSPKPIGSAVTDPDGSDQDVTAFDNFTLGKSAIVSRVTWRGSSSSDAMSGFAVKVYTSNPDPYGPPDTTSPLAEINVPGKANEQPVGSGWSDYSADFARPLALTGGVQYWISIVSIRNIPSVWGWASGTGGDGKSIQSYAEFKILAAPNDRAFSLGNESAELR